MVTKKTPSTHEEAFREEDMVLQEEPAISFPLYRVVRALMFNAPPQPELEALPMAQLRLFWAVRYGEDATMKELSERLEVSQSTVTQLADRLVNRDLIERYIDPNDRRVVRLRLSTHGRRVFAATDRFRQETQRAVWDALGNEEQQQILHVLERLGQLAEETCATLGRPLPPLAPLRAASASEASSDASAAQPVVDLMTRRVRGQQAL